MEKTKESRIIYNGKFITLLRDRVILESGRETEREVVLHKGSVVIIPYDEKEGCIYFVKQYRYPLKNYLVELPAGKLEEEENPYHAANRELSEEIGFYSNNLRKLGTIASSPGFVNEILHVFIAKELVKKENEKDFDENIEIIKVKIKDLKKFLLQQEMVDGKTLASFFLWEMLECENIIPS